MKRYRAYIRQPDQTLVVDHTTYYDGTMHIGQHWPIKPDHETVELKGWPDKVVYSYASGKILVSNSEI